MVLLTIKTTLFVTTVYVSLIQTGSKIRTAHIYRRSVDKNAAVTGCSPHERGLSNWWLPFSWSDPFGQPSTAYAHTQYEINPTRLPG